MRFKRWQVKGRREFYSNKGYTHVYDDLVHLLTLSLSDINFFWLLFWLHVPLALTIPIVFSDTVQQQLALLVLGIVFFIVAWILFVVLAGYAAVRHSSRSVLFIAARILTAVPKPYLRELRFGLGYHDIDKLRSVAKIEQGAADWRGGVVTVLVIGSATAFLGTSWIFWREMLTAMNYGFQLEAIPLPGRPGLPIWLIIIAGLIVFGVAVNLFYYAVHFVTRESANRTVLFACVEAQSLLERLQLTGESDFTNLQKRALAAHLGCRLIPAKTSSFYEKFIGSTVNGLDENIWLLIPPVKYSYDAQVIIWYDKLKRWIMQRHTDY